MSKFLKIRLRNIGKVGLLNLLICLNKNMKKIILGIAIALTLLVTTSVEARVTKVKSYYKPSTGKYVSSYYKTTPNKTKIDNFSTKGNYNSYTGKKGYVNPYKY